MKVFFNNEEREYIKGLLNQAQEIYGEKIKENDSVEGGGIRVEVSSVDDYYAYFDVYRLVATDCQRVIKEK